MLHVDGGGMHFSDDLEVDRHPSTQTAERPSSLAAPSPSSFGPQLPLLAPETLRLPSPYVPIDEVGATRLSEQVPGADGRGVTVPIVEGVPDLFHPSLQHALTLDGSPIAKRAGIIDAHWLTAVTSLKSNDVLWDGRPAQYTVERDETVTAPTSRVIYGGRE